MVIGIIGGGRVGGTLGRGLARAGHRIAYGVRDPADPKYATLQHPNAEVLSVPQATAKAQVVILATPWSAVESALRDAGDFGGKVLIDATNPIGAGFVLTHGHTDSGAEQVARWAKNARVVKAFNSTGAENMSEPNFGEQRAAMFVCGDDADACATAQQLAKELGFDPYTVGPLSMARTIEPVAMLWINLALVQGLGRNFALGILRR